MAAFIHNIYDGIENSIKRMLSAKGHSLNMRSPAWHQELLGAAVEYEIISEDLRLILKDYLGFRHVFVHACGVLLEAERLLPLASQVQDVWQAFLTEIEAAYRTLKH